MRKKVKNAPATVHHFSWRRREFEPGLGSNPTNLTKLNSQYGIIYVRVFLLFFLPAKVYENSLEDEDRAGTAEDSERLTPQQAEESTGQRMTQEGLQHTLQ